MKHKLPLKSSYSASIGDIKLKAEGYHKIEKLRDFVLKDLSDIFTKAAKIRTALGEYTEDDGEADDAELKHKRKKLTEIDLMFQ